MVRDPAGVREVSARVLEQLDTIVPRMGQAYRDEVPEYAALSDDQLNNEVLVISRHFVHEFFSRNAAGADLDDADLSPVTGAGRRRLEMGVPLESSLHVFRIAGRVVWNAVVDATREGEEHILADLAGQWIDYVDRASSAFAEGYLAASNEHLRKLDARRRAIVDALLAADDAADVAAVAARFSLSLPRAYVPALVAGDDVSTRIDHLLHVAPRDTLAGFQGDRVLLLVPEPIPQPERFARSLSATLLAYGTPARPGPELTREVAHVEGVLDAAVRAGRREGVFGPDDLLIEQLLSEHPRAAAALRRFVVEALTPQDPDGIFRSTLRTYLGCGSVPRTAELEVVHANTVSYRLKRVREVTGLDPRVPADAALLVLALTTTGEPS